MKGVLGIIALMLAIGAICWLLVSCGANAEERDADRTCHALGAEKVYTGNFHYLCVTPDGRVVGTA